MWCAGARETPWTTCHNGVIVTKTKQSLRSPYFSRTLWYLKAITIRSCFFLNCRAKSIFKSAWVLKKLVSNRFPMLSEKVKHWKNDKKIYRFEFYKLSVKLLFFNFERLQFFINRFISFLDFFMDFQKFICKPLLFLFFEESFRIIYKIFSDFNSIL